MMEILKSLLASQTNLLWVVLISGVVSTAVSYWFRRRETRDRLETEYVYEQKKKLHDLIGKYHGHVLNAAGSLNYRLFDLYNNATEEWLRPSLNDDGSYFYSSVYRFMNVCSVIRQFEREALYVDGRYAEERDFLFVKYLNALRLCMTDTALWKGLDYVDRIETHHFFADTFRQYCDSCIDSNGNFLSYIDFVERVRTDDSSLEEYEFSLKKDEALKSVLKFFYLLSPRELRWDRLVSFHLILVELINSFGYPEQEEPEARINHILSQVKHKKVRRNLLDWLPARGLGHEPLMKTITDFVAKSAEQNPTPRAKR